MYFKQKHCGLTLAILSWAIATHANDLVPVTNVVDVTSGGYNGNDICIVQSSGAVKCYRILVPGDAPDTYFFDQFILSSFVEDVPEFGKIKKFATNYGQNLTRNCAVTTTGSAICWGESYYLGLGIEERDYSLPTGIINFATPIGLDSGVESMAVSSSQSCALMTTGEVKCWGLHEEYLGIGTKSTTDSDWEIRGQSPNAVINIDNATAITVADQSACALLDNNTVKCWGRNYAGEVGNGTTEIVSSPVEIANLTDVKAITSGQWHVCALTNAGAVKCWGLNDSGQLGNNTRTNSSSPVDVIGLNSGVTSIAAGMNHTCAILEQGNIKCWGWNNSNQLGNNQNNIGYGGGHQGTMLPVDVLDLNGRAIRIVAGADSTCALMEDSTVKCWGSQGIEAVHNGRVGDLGLSNKMITVMMEKPQTSGIQVSAPTNGLVAYYPFEGDVNDASNHGHDGVIYGNTENGKESGKVIFRAGKIGNAARFNGIGGSKIEFPTIDKTYFGTNDFTLSFFVKFNLNTYKMSVMSKRPICNHTSFFDIQVAQANNYNGAFEMDDNKNYHLTPFSRLQTDTWQLVTVIRQGKILSTYVDGQLDGQKTTDTILDISSDAIFGINSSPCIGMTEVVWLSGKVDELRVYNRALSIDEIQMETACPSGSQRGLAFDVTGQVVATKTCFQNNIQTPQGLQANYSRFIPPAEEIGNIRLSVTVTPEAAHVGKSAESFVVAYIPTLIAPDSFMKVGQGWELWDEKLTALKAATQYSQLPTNFEEFIFDGLFTSDLSGNYTMFVGYRLNDGTLIYNGNEPMSFFVRP